MNFFVHEFLLVLSGFVIFNHSVPTQ